MKKKKNLKYYIAYGLSFFVLLSIWIGPSLLIQKEDDVSDEIFTKRMGDLIIQEIKEPKEEEEKRVWSILSNLDTILSVIVGGVNVYLITSHYRSKKRERELKDDPKRIRRIFDPEPFD